jgi:hypothetical protein
MFVQKENDESINAGNSMKLVIYYGQINRFYVFCLSRSTIRVYFYQS